MEDGKKEFVSLSEIYPLDDIPDSTFKEVVNRMNQKSTSFNSVLKYAAWILVVIGDIALLAHLITSDVIKGLGFFAFINLLAVFICWLFYTIILNGDVE
ncbi:hypothetical protein Elgi_37220 [Paenibacillus elgii]|uniref:hypothetical protein n=1 Tax=Paenibacillus elgii TaxID=189691 RepID=UPI002D7A8FCC|nr:hypothetical protein Elgi_37220 [Paenibacillus elgii]